MTQRQLATAAGLSKGHINDLVFGRSASPKLSTAIKIRDATGGVVTLESWVQDD